MRPLAGMEEKPNRGRNVQPTGETKWNHNCRVQPSSAEVQLSACGCCGGPATRRTCVEELRHVGSRSGLNRLSSVMCLSLRWMLENVGFYCGNLSELLLFPVSRDK